MYARSRTSKKTACQPAAYYAEVQCFWAVKARAERVLRLTRFGHCSPCNGSTTNHDMNLFASILLKAGLTAGLLSPVQAPTQPDTVPVTVVVTNLFSPTAVITLNFYNSSDSFLKSGKAALYKKVVPQQQQQVQLKVDLPPGEWAIALSQDVNDNGEMDRNFLGIPTEPYAFSNNVRPRFKAPDFEECKFVAEGEGQTVTIRLEK